MTVTHQVPSLLEIEDAFLGVEDALLAAVSAPKKLECWLF
jgi:hypothetical protein